MRPSVNAAAVAALMALSCSEPAATETFFALVAAGADGTVAVEGVELDVAGATLRIYDEDTSVQLVDGDDLAARVGPGRLVWLRGERRGATARIADVFARAVVIGPVAGRSDAAVAVGGVEVGLAPDTRILDASGAAIAKEDLPGGARVLVSGWAEGLGRVRATAIRVRPGTPAIRVRGWSLGAPVDGRFAFALLQEGAPVLQVDASAIVPAPHVPASALVRVEGDGIAQGTLAASAVAVEAQALPMTGDVAVLDGLVTAVEDDRIVMGDHRIRRTGETRYEGVPAGGSEAAALVPRARLLVQGTMAGEHLVAERIRFVDLTRLSGRVQPGSFHLGQPSTSGSFAVGGKLVVLDPLTEIRDSSGAPLTLLELAERHGLEPLGVPVVLHGSLEQDGTLRAYRVDQAEG